MFVKKSYIGETIATSWGNDTEDIDALVKSAVATKSNAGLVCLLAAMVEQSIETNKLLRKVHARLKPFEDAAKIALADGKRRRDETRCPICEAYES